MQPDRVEFKERSDKKGNPYLEIRYYDVDAQYLSEVYFFNNITAQKKFQINFLRAHLRRPELAIEINNPSQVIRYQALFRLPAYVIARKQDKYWKVTEKVFAEEL
jgi:DNA repair protein RadD